MGEGSGCIVEKTMAARRDLPMTDSGSVRTENHERGITSRANYVCVLELL
jgi:hypothetical protein